MTCGLENTTRFQGRAFKRHFIVVLFTTRRRSSEQGTVFTPVCLFTGGSLYDVTSCLAAWSHVPSGWVSGPIFLLEGLPDSDPWTETPLWTEPRPGQRLSTQTPWTETIWTETPLDRDPPCSLCLCCSKRVQFTASERPTQSLITTAQSR